MFSIILVIHHFCEPDMVWKDKDFVIQSLPQRLAYLTKETVKNSPVAQRIKHLPAMRETRVQSLVWEDPLEKEMATHSSIFAWRIPWTEEPGRLQSTGWQRVGHDWASSFHFTSPKIKSFNSTELHPASIFIKLHRASFSVHPDWQAGRWLSVHNQIVDRDLNRAFSVTQVDQF